MEDKLFRFLVIDDDPINNMVCKAAIKSATGGIIAKCFTNPLEGLKYVRNELTSSGETTPVILFLDINMPEMSGWDWLESYKDFPESIKNMITVYILSSSVSPTDIELAHSNRLVKDYLSKPINKAKVIEIMETTSKEMHIA